MAKKVEDPDEPVIEPEEEHPSRDAETQVDLREEGKKPDAAAEAKAADEKRWKALENQNAAQRRIAESIQRELKELKEQQAKAPKPESQPTGAQVLPAGTSQDVVDKYDQLVADGKWQEAVRVLSREEYKVLRETERAEEQIRTSQERKLAAWERNKQKVRDAYPMLKEGQEDPESPELALYNQAVAELTQEDDQFIHDPYAPVMAMHRMEELAKSQGVKLNRNAEATPPARTPVRAGPTSMPVSRGSGGAATYTLSREQKEWCDVNLSHLPEGERYKHYARYAKMAEAGGVEA